MPEKAKYAINQTFAHKKIVSKFGIFTLILHV